MSYLSNKDSSHTRKSVLELSSSTPSSGNKSYKHNRLSRGDASEVGSAMETHSHPSTLNSCYTQKELDSLKKTKVSAIKDYKKLFEEALAENEKLKACLEHSKQDLAKLHLQLDKITQKQDEVSERSSLYDSENKTLIHQPPSSNHQAPLSKPPRNRSHV